MMPIMIVLHKGTQIFFLQINERQPTITFFHFAWKNDTGLVYIKKLCLGKTDGPQ